MIGWAALSDSVISGLLLTAPGHCSFSWLDSMKFKGQGWLFLWVRRVQGVSTSRCWGLRTGRAQERQCCTVVKVMGTGARLD